MPLNIITSFSKYRFKLNEVISISKKRTSRAIKETLQIVLKVYKKFNKSPKKEKITLVWEEFKGQYKEASVYLILGLLICSLSSNILHYLADTFVIKITSAFISKWENDLIFILTFLASFAYILISKLILKKLFPSLLSLLRSSSIILIYFNYIRPNCYFKHSHITFINYIEYLDLFWLSIAILSLRLKPYKTILASQEQFALIEDNIDINNFEDELSRKPFADKIAKHINSTINLKAFSIAVIGNWGSGKTTFMNLIEENLKVTNREVNLTIRYNPWRVSQPKVMIEDFFQSFINEIDSFDDNLSSKIKSYSNSLLDLDESFISKLTTFSFNLAIKEYGNADSIIKAHNEINELIKNTGKRFVIFIDDVDRLTGNEIVQVIKIIRNTADFSNVFFVVGIDYNYVVSAMTTSAEIPNSTTYLQKIFQLEIILPPFDLRKILPRLKTNLGYDKLEADEKIRFDLVFDKLSLVVTDGIYGPQNNGLIERNLTSFRDVVRYSNSFKISYQILKEHVDLIDLFHLEIIKLKYPVIYMKMATKELLKFSFETLQSQKFSAYSFDHEKLDALLQKECAYLAPYQSEIIQICDTLYSSYNKYSNSFRSIIRIENHLLYYNFSLFENSISITDWQSVKDMPLDKILVQLEKWKDENKGNILKNILREFIEYKDREEFAKFIRVKLAIDGDFWREEIYRNLLDKEMLKERYNFKNDEEIKTFIEEIFNDENVPFLSRISLAERLIRTIILNSSEPYFDKKYLSDKILQMFIAYAEIQNKISNETMKAYYSNIDNIDLNSTKIILNQKANEFMREFISAHPEDYLTIVLRPQYYPSGEEYVFEPFLKQTFKDPGKGKDNGYENFKDFLINFKGNERLKQFLTQKFTEYESANYTHVNLSTDEIKYLNEIQHDLI